MSCISNRMNEVGIFIPLKVKSASEYEIINTAILLGCFVHHNFMTFGGDLQALDLLVSLGGRKIAFHSQKGKKERNVFVLSFIHSLREKEWVIRWARMEEGTEYTYRGPSSRVEHALHPCPFAWQETPGRICPCQAQSLPLTRLWAVKKTGSTYGETIRKPVYNFLLQTPICNFQSKSWNAFILSYSCVYLVNKTEEDQGRINYEISTSVQFSLSSQSPWLVSLLMSPATRKSAGICNLRYEYESCCVQDSWPWAKQISVSLHLHSLTSEQDQKELPPSAFMRMQWVNYTQLLAQYLAWRGLGLNPSSVTCTC